MPLTLTAPLLVQLVESPLHLLLLRVALFARSRLQLRLLPVVLLLLLTVCSQPVSIS